MLYLGNIPRERPASPILDWGKDGQPAMLPNGPLDHQHTRINRIPLIRTALVDVLSVESPSRVWVRLKNHITEKLTVREPQPVEPLSEDELVCLNYCLAPIEERVYGRARILEIDADATYVRTETSKLVRVLFIDEGVTDWVYAEALAKMDPLLCFFPWQAILISICGPHISTDFQDILPKHSAISWSEKECELMRTIVGKFKMFKTHTVLSSVITNDYRQPIKVDLYGFMNDSSVELCDGVSIGNYFAARCPRRIELVDIVDAHLQKNYPKKHQQSVLNELSSLAVPEWRRSFPSKWDIGDKAIELENAYANWHPDNAIVPTLEPHYLYENFADESGHVAICVEGAFTESPYEFYARPIRLHAKTATPLIELTDDENKSDSGKIDNYSAAMLEGDKTLCEAADILDEFYSIERNRSPLKTTEINEWLRSGKTIYAICACTEERARYTGEWQRVQILSLKSNAEVRFLDTGGRDLVLSSSLYKLHPKHCTYPPMCAQFCVQGIADVSEEMRRKKIWSLEAKELWRMLLREDIPLIIRGPITRPNMERNSPESGVSRTPVVASSSPVYTEFHVLCIKDVIVEGESSSIVEMFQQPQESSQHALAVASPSAPVNWSSL